MQNTVTVDDGINVSVGYQLVSGYNILTIGGRPVYQFIGDTSHDTANGSVVSGWEAIDKSGNSQTSAKSTTADDTLIASRIGATKTRTEGNSGAKISLNSANSLVGFVYEYLENATNQIQVSYSVNLGSVETVYLATADMLTTINSDVVPFAHRRYFLVSNITANPSLSIDGRLNGQGKSSLEQLGLEQRLQRHQS